VADELPVFGNVQCGGTFEGSACVVQMAGRSSFAGNAFAAA
jgi:hypothetical protein